MSNDINEVVISGRLTANAVLKRIASGSAVCSFTIASNRSRLVNQQWQEETSFIAVELWGAAAERWAPRLLKGTPATISGSLLQQRWEKDGHKYSRLLLSARNVQVFASSPNAGQQNMQSGNGGGNVQNAGYPTPQNAGPYYPPENGNPPQQPQIGDYPNRWEPGCDFPEEILF